MTKKKVQYTDEDNKKTAAERLNEKRVDKKTAIRVHVEYKWEVAAAGLSFALPSLIVVLACSAW